MIETEIQKQFGDRMNAGAVPFTLTYSSFWHLAAGGERLRVSDAVVIPRVVLLIDVSKWQGEIDFVQMRASGVDGVIIKCGQGLAQDPYFLENMRKAKEAGLARGTYWFFDSRVDPREQARLWWEWIKDDPGELMHFADYEENYNGSFRGWNNLYLFIFHFQRFSLLPSSKIGIYTGFFYWIAHSPTDLASLAWFAQFALWLAWYTDNPEIVKIPKPWTNATLVLWQYGTPTNGKLRGVQSLEIDENNFNGDKPSYIQRFELDVIPPPTGESPMTFTGTAKSTATPNVRVRKPFPDGSLDVNGQTIAGIQPNAPFKADNVASDLLGRQWVHVIEAGGSPANGWSAGWLLNYEAPTPTPPSPPPVPALPSVIFIATKPDMSDKAEYRKL